MTTPIPERVATGAKWLDEVDPGWHRSINLDALQMVTCSNCIVGQRVRALAAKQHGAPKYVDFTTVVGPLPGTHSARSYAPPRWVKHLAMSPDEAEARGFSRGDGDGDYFWDELDAEWTTQVEKRLADDGSL